MANHIFSLTVKLKKLEYEALRLISLASTLTCFVMTQVAILSFAAENFPLSSSGLTGIIFGGASGIVGIYMIFQSNLLQKRPVSEERDVIVG